MLRCATHCVYPFAICLIILTICTIYYRLGSLTILEQYQLLPDKVSPEEFDGRQTSAHEEDTPVKKQRLIDQYCNPSESLHLGEEGSGINGYELLSVQVLTRHGVRVPLSRSTFFGPLSFPKVRCSMLRSKNSLGSLQANYMVRTNSARLRARRTEWEFPLRSHSKYCEPAQLTPNGAQQHLRLGQLFYQVYNSRLGISQDSLRVISTYTSRTYQSAVALVSGLLFGNVDFMELHIEPINTLFCRGTRESCQCPKAEFYLKRGLRTLEKLQDGDLNYQQLISRVGRSFRDSYGQQNLKYPLRKAFTMFTANMCNDIALPHSTKYAPFTESEADLSWKSQRYYHRQMLKVKDLRMSSKLLSHHLLQELVLRLSNHSTQTSSQIQDKFTVYSGHDNTIIPLLLALGLPVQQWPPFASRLIFELYKPLGSSQSKTKEHIFKLIYNGKDVTNLLKFCVSNVAHSFQGCMLKDLINYSLHILAGIGHNYYDACKLRPTLFVK